MQWFFATNLRVRGHADFLKHSLYVFHVKFGMRWRSDNKSGHTKGEGGKFASLVRTASNPCRRTSLQRRKKIFLFHALNSFHWINTNRRKGLLNNQHLRNRILLLLLVGFKHIYFSTLAGASKEAQYPSNRRADFVQRYHFWWRNT